MEIVSILAFIIAIIGGFKLLHEGIEFLQVHFHLSGKLLPYLSFLIIFIGIIILMNILGKVLKKVIDMTLLGGFDNVAGGLMGVFKWAFGLSVLIWIFNYFEINIVETYADEASVYPLIASFAPKVVEYISVILPFASDLFSSVETIV